MELDIYTDGSHLDKQHGGRLGIGGVIVNRNKLLGQFSKELTPTYMKSNFDADNCSNPSAELVAVLIALRNFKEFLRSVDSVLIHADYIGVKEWMTGNWRIKEKYIANIKAAIDEEIDSQDLNNKIQYTWVKGHQKADSIEAYWNNYVDKLAKGEI